MTTALPSTPGTLIVEPEATASPRTSNETTPEPAPSAKPTPAPTAQRPLTALLPGATTSAPPTTGAATRRTLAAVGLLLFMAVALWALTRMTTTPAPALATPIPSPMPTAAPTSGPTSTALPPDVAPKALVGYFDYRDAGTAVALERGESYTAVGRAGTHWLLLKTHAGAQVWVLAEDLERTVDASLPDSTPPPPAVPAAPRAAAPAAPAASPVCQNIVVTRDVAADVTLEDGTILPNAPIGRVEGYGCTQADAEANAAAQEAAMRAGR